MGLGATVHTCALNEAEMNRCLRDWEEEGFGVTGSVCDVVGSNPARGAIGHCLVCVRWEAQHSRKPSVLFLFGHFS